MRDLCPKKYLFHKAGLLTACLLALAQIVPNITNAGAVPVWTQHNDNSRTGANLNETVLNTSNVNPEDFGKLFSYTLDDQIYTQPLYIPHLIMAVDHAAHNVVFVATVNNSVYAFDADNDSVNSGNPLWKTNLATNGGRPPTIKDMDALGACDGYYSDFSGKMGIVGTPVIDTTTNTLYVVARTIEGKAAFQRLHALDITNGHERPGSPIVISGSYKGVVFDPQIHNQRPALTLANGIVYVAWASHCDNGNYHGWIMGFKASDLSLTSIWNATPTGWAAGVWQAGQGLTVDADNNLYFVTGNGTFDGTSNFGESFVKLHADNHGALAVVDYFAPSNWNVLNGWDADLGASGVLAIPKTKLLLSGGKEGRLYLLDSDNLGKQGNTDSIVQEFQVSLIDNNNSGHIHGAPIYWNGPRSVGQMIYVWPENDYLRAYSFTNGVDSHHGAINSTPIAMSTVRAPETNSGMPGGFLSLSANAAKPGGGIVWALTPYDGDANHVAVNGILRAFDASNVSRELWNSEINSERDTVGKYAKFNYVTVANGKVYAPSWGNASAGTGALQVYGLLPNVAHSMGTGLTGAYYANASLAEPATMTRLDPVVDFDWNTASPDPSIPLSHYSVRWTGMVQAENAGTYTFSTTSDDGVRLWINGKLVIDNWTDHAPVLNTSSGVILKANQKAHIVLEYYQNMGGAIARLLWTPPGSALQIIPKQQLYPGR